MRLICITRFLFLSLLFFVVTSTTHAGSAVCKRMHSCPPDDGSYICGDKGYCSSCPDNQHCSGGKLKSKADSATPENTHKPNSEPSSEAQKPVRHSGREKIPCWRGRRMSPLHEAACSGDTAKAQKLLDEGADIDDQDNDATYAPLHWAAINFEANMIRYLVDKGADVDIPTRVNTTPLYFAITKGYPEIVELLLELGADTSIKDDFGRDTFEVARQFKRPEILKILEEHGKE